MATKELFDTSTKTQQLIPKESRIKLNEQRNCELNVNNYNNALLDVEFSFNSGETKLKAHKFILLDCPPSEFFVEKLAKNVGHGLVVIEVPNEINSESADAILDFIYGKPLIELWVTNHEFDLEGFLNGARFFQMEIMFLKQLATISRVPNPRLESYVSNNFQRLKTSAEFWNMENELILQLCRAIPLESEIVVDGFLDWIYENKAKRREFLDKLMELRRLIKLRIENDDDRGVPVELEPSLTLANEHLESEENESDATGTQPVERPGNARRNQKRKVKCSASFKRHPKRSKSNSSNGDYNSGSDTAENESSQHTSEEIEQINLDVELEPRRGKRTSQKRKCIQRNPSSSHRHPKISKPGPSTKTKNSKPSKMDGFFNRNLNYIRTKLTEKKWRQKEFSEGWTTIWEYMTLKNNKLQAVKNEQTFVHGKGFDLLLDSRKAIGNDYNKYPIFSQAFINIVYNFSGGRHFDSIIQDEIMKYLLEDVKNPCNFKEHDSTLAGQTLAEILDLYDSAKWSLNISRKLVSTKLEEAILNCWDFNGTRTMNYIHSLPNLKDLVDLIESEDSTATLCGLWLMVYHTKSDTPNEQRHEEALKYVEYLKKETSFQSTLINCEGVGIKNRHVATYVRKLVDIFEFDNDNFFNKQLHEIRTHLSKGTWETISFTTAWVSVSKILFNRDFGNMYEYEFLNEDGISLLIDSRRKLGKEYEKYPFFFEEFLNIIYLFSCKECYVRFVFTDQIIEFILEDLPRYDTFGDSVTAGEIACYLLHFYKPNDWQSISTTREDVAARIKEAISGHWDLNVDLDLCYSDSSDFDVILDMIRSNDRTLNLLGVWMLTYSTKSDTTNELRNKKAKTYISWLKNTKNLKENLRKFVQQTEDSHISNLAQQLMTNFGFWITSVKLK